MLSAIQDQVKVKLRDLETLPVPFGFGLGEDSWKAYKQQASQAQIATGAVGTIKWRGSGFYEVKFEIGPKLQLPESFFELA